MGTIAINDRDAHATRHLCCGVVAVAVFIWLTPSARAAEIVGRVSISGKPVADAVVSIEALESPAPAGATLHTIDHRDLSFAPHVLVVRAGATVRFQSRAGMPCRLYSISPEDSFVLRPDGPQTVRFDRPGIIEVRCADHPRALAYVIVKGHAYVAVTDKGGRYRISNVPPGRYPLQAWYEGVVVTTRTVDVGNAPLTVEIEAVLPPRQPGTEQESDRASLLRAPSNVMHRVWDFLGGER